MPCDLLDPILIGAGLVLVFASVRVGAVMSAGLNRRQLIAWCAVVAVAVLVLALRLPDSGCAQ